MIKTLSVKETQSEQILQHLVQHGSITSLEAYQLYNCLRLGARIWDLKQEGYSIDSSMVEVESGKKVAKYSLIKSDSNGQLSFL